MTNWSGSATIGATPNIIVVAGAPGTTISVPISTTDASTFAKIRFTEIQTCITLLEARYFELLDEADLSIGAGDFKRARGSQMLGELRRMLEEYRKELKVWFAEYSGLMGIASAGIQGRSWNDRNARTDLSTRSVLRTTI